MPSSNSFPRKEKLKHKKLFQSIFSRGQSKFIYPVRMIWIALDPSTQDTLFQVGVTVPKKNFKKAYQRNKLKRLLREGYRLNKSNLYADQTKLQGQHAVIFIYTAKEILPVERIHRSIKNLTKHLQQELSQ